MGALPAASIAASAALPWAGQALGLEQPEWAGDTHANPDAEAHSLSQRLESVGQQPSMPNQRLESLAGDDKLCAFLLWKETAFWNSQLLNEDSPPYLMLSAPAPHPL
jgi:hypothetical protein